MTNPETILQNRIEREIGADLDVLLRRNTVGVCRYFNEETGERRAVTYGLGQGSPDLLVLMPHPGRAIGHLFGLEVKVPGESSTALQKKIQGVWRQFGCVTETVHSPLEARRAIEGFRRLMEGW